MMYEATNENQHMQGQQGEGTGRSQRDEIYSLRVPAGKRTYFFDVKTTRSGKDYFITITESKRIGENRYEKHKIFLYKEDFGKFLNALHEVIRYIQEECLPEYEFKDLPGVLSETTEEAHEEEETDHASELLNELDSTFSEFSEESSEEDEEKPE